jgi:hypothetical protein
MVGEERAESGGWDERVDEGEGFVVSRDIHALRISEAYGACVRCCCVGFNGFHSEALIIAGAHLYRVGCGTTDTMIAIAAVELASQLFDIGIGLGGKHASFYLEIYA